MSDLQTLRARVREAKGAEREIDLAMLNAFHPEGRSYHWTNLAHIPGASDQRQLASLDDRFMPPPEFGISMLELTDEFELLTTVPAYTSSIDAAVALIERVLPRELPDILHEAKRALGQRHHWHVEFYREGQIQELPLLLIDALLSALLKEPAI